MYYMEINNLPKQLKIVIGVKFSGLFGVVPVFVKHPLTV